MKVVRRAPVRRLLLFLAVLFLTVSGNALFSGEGNWTTSGPAGPRIRHFEVHPLDPSVILASSNWSIYRSIDAGVTWSALPSLPSSPSSFVITKTGKICFVSNSGLFVLTNGNWQQAPAPPNAPLIYCVEANPGTPETLYLGTSKGIYVTPNFGSSWQTLNSDLIDSYGYLYHILALAFSPQNSNVLYAGTNNGILKTVDAGTNWDLVTSMCRNVITLMFDPLVPATVYAGSNDYEGGIYRTLDSGLNWNSLGLNGIKVQAISLGDSPGVLYAGTANRDFAALGALWASEDNGENWSPIRDGCTYGSVQGVVAEMGSILIGAEDGVYRSEDHGATWSTQNSAFAAPGWIDDINIDPRAPNRLLAAQGNFFYKSHDAGASWRTVSFPEGVRVNRIARASSAPDIVYAILNDSSLAVSEDSGESWSRIATTGLPVFVPFRALAVHPTNPSVLYTLPEGNGVAKSTDAGRTWQLCNSGLPDYHFGMALAIDPQQPDIVYASLQLRGIYKTTNGGNTWSGVNTGLTSIYITQIVIDPGTPSTVYASAIQRGGSGAWGPGGVYKSTDGAQHWSRCPLDLASYDEVVSIAIDAAQPSDIYAASEFGVFLISHNQGTDWQGFLPSLPESAFHLHPLVISAYGLMLYLGTEQGLYSLHSRGNFTLGGYLGVGTDAPQRAVHLKGPNSVFRMDRTADTASFLLVRTDATGNPLKSFLVGANAAGTNQGEFIINDMGAAVGGAGLRRMTIANTGDTIFSGNLTGASFTPSSSLRLKTNIRPLGNPLAKVTALSGVRFNWKATGQASLGVVAEEVARVLPEVVFRAPKTGLLEGVSYDSLVALLLESAKAQSAQIETLRAKREQLKRLLEKLSQANDKLGNRSN